MFEEGLVDRSPAPAGRRLAEKLCCLARCIGQSSLDKRCEARCPRLELIEDGIGIADSNEIGSWAEGGASFPNYGGSQMLEPPEFEKGGRGTFFRHHPVP